jgi:CBS domain-containing protein
VSEIGRPPVDYVMSKPVYFVDENDLVERASDTMKRYGVKKILVKRNQTPIGVLENWKIGPRDFDKKVKDIPLGEIRLMSQDSDLEDVEKALAMASAVYIVDRNQKDDIIGVVTTYDLYKAGF